MDALQESILAEAEMMDLLSDPQAVPRATVIEARNILGLGACATVIVREGTLKPGIFCATDTTYTRIRSLTDTTTGKVVKLALPSQPCEITGWKNSVLPLIGSDLNQFSSETECKKWIDAGERDREFIEVRQGESEASKREALDKQLLRLRKERARDLTLKPIHIHSYDSLANQTDPNIFILEVMLYADVTGSLEALKKALADLPRDKVQLKIVSSELGPPTPSTLQHLSASPVILVAFNVTVPKAIEKSLQDRGIKSIQHGVIYHLLDEIKENMVSLLPPVESESPQGTARVLQLFPFGTKEIVAGCNIEDGLFLRSQSSNFKYNLERNDRIIWTGSIKTLKHFKKDITQAQKGMECGIVLDGLDPNLLQLNDVIKCVKITRTPQKI